MMLRARVLAAVTGTFAMMAVVACGSDDGDGATTDDATDVTGSGDTARIELSDSPVGEILVDGDGRTLYLFTEDSPGESVCSGECVANWPPVEGEAEAGEGVDAELLGSLERDDGTVQVTYADWPLYYYAADDAGDLNGQGVNDVWYVIDADGEAVEDDPEGATETDDSEDADDSEETDDSDGGGYGY